MANIRKLATKNLNQLSLSNTFLYLLNTATNVESRISLTSLVGGNAISTGSGVSIYSGLVNNTLNFKSLLATDSVVALTTTSSGELSIGITLANLDLSLCKNTTTPFLSTVDLATNVGSTILPVANGGTGAATLTDGGILLGSGTGAITAMAALGAGTIIQGDGTTDPAALAIGTAGQVLTVNAGATAVEWGAAAGADNLGNHTATTTLDMAGNNIDLGSGFINKDGAGSLGLSIDAGNNTHIQPDGSAITGGTEALNISGSIFLQGTANRTITTGAPVAGNGSLFTIQGATVTDANDGGSIAIKPGASNSGTGGDLNIYAGASTSGSAGDLRLYTSSGATTFPILRVANDKKVSIQNSAVVRTPVGLLDVEQTEAGGAIPVLRLNQLDADFAFAQFNGTAAADSSTNISSSAGTAGTKNGAIKVRIQNGVEAATDHWIRLYTSAV